jgi:hypothetical protein
MQPYITANTPYSASMVFPGDGHVPWQSNAAKFHQIDTMITSFLFKALGQPMNAVCTNTPLGVNDLNTEANIAVYPNPASNLLNISCTQMISDITISDETGRTVAQANDIKALNYQMNTSRLNAGVYFVRISNADNASAVRKIVIE